MTVHTTLGFGFLEAVYRNALLLELRRANLTCIPEHPLSVTYDSIVAGQYFADILIPDQLIIELKACDMLHKAHELQLVNYLKATGIETGLLLNFGTPSLQFKKKFRTLEPPIR